MHRSLFGTVIKKLRLKRGISQERLASLSDLERTFISMLERGIKQPSLKTICALAKAFDLKNYELLHLVEHEIHSIHGTSDDLQDREEAQHQLDELEVEQDRLRIGEIVDSIPVVFFARTPMPEYAVTFVSKNIKQLLGYDRETLMASNHTWMDYIHPDDKPGLLAQLQKIKANGQINHEYRIQSACGQWLWIREEVKLVIDETGMPKEILGSMTGAPYASRTN